MSASMPVGSGGGGGGGVGRKMTPKGQMSSSNSGPAIMMMPNHIRETFMPDPPLRFLPIPSTKRCRPKIYFEEEEEDEDSSKEKQSWPKSKRGITGLAAYMQYFVKSSTKTESKATVDDKKTRSPTSIVKKKRQEQYEDHVLVPQIKNYRVHQRECGGEFRGMNCYKTLFVGRLAYEVTERKLLREMEVFGPIKDIRLIFNRKKDTLESTNGKNGEYENGDSGGKKSRGYAFVEYEHEEDMKRAYRAADGMKIEGREIVVDVERAHTVPNWLPRRLGGGLGGTRLGGSEVNVTIPGRFDPSKSSKAGEPVSAPYFPQGPPPHLVPIMAGGYGGGPPMGYGGPPPLSIGGPPSFSNSNFEQRYSGGYYPPRSGGGRGYPPSGVPPGRYGPPGDSRGSKRGRSRSPSPPRNRDGRRGRY